MPDMPCLPLSPFIDASAGSVRSAFAAHGVHDERAAARVRVADVARRARVRRYALLF